MSSHYGYYSKIDGYSAFLSGKVSVLQMHIYAKYCQSIGHWRQMFSKRTFLIFAEEYAEDYTLICWMILMMLFAR